MPSLWIDALKQFNFERGAWCIPRKGSDDYMKVRALMADKAGKDAKKAEAPAKKAESPPKKAEAPPKKAESKKAEAPPKKAEAPPKKAESKKTESKVKVPKLKSLSGNLKKSMDNALIHIEDTHKYNAGTGHPIDYILNRISRNKHARGLWGENYEKAVEFLEAVEKYVNSKAIAATWNGKPQKMILVDDWNKIYH